MASRKNINGAGPELSPELKRKFALFDKNYAKAESLRESGHSEEAYSAYMACIKIFDNQPTIDHLVFIMLGMGFCQADLHHWDQALEIYHWLEQILDLIRNTQNKKKEAAEDGKKTSDPSTENLWLEGIEKLWPQGVTGLVVPDNFKPLELDTLYNSIALAYDNSDRAQKAMDYYHLAVQTSLDYGRAERAAETWRFMAAGCQRREDWENLQLAAENMLQLYTETANLSGKIEAWRFLAQVHTNQNCLGKAQEYLRLLVAVEESVRHPDLNQDKKLLKDLHDLLNGNRDQDTRGDESSPESLINNQAGDHILAERYQEALEASNQALKIASDNVKALSFQVNALWRLGRLEDALNVANRAIDLEPNNSHSYFSRGIVYEQQDRIDDALADYNRSIDLDPIESMAYNNRGCVYTKLGESEKALADFYRAIEVKPDHANAYFSLGFNLQGRFEYTKALQYFEIAQLLGHKHASQFAEDLREKVNHPIWERSLEKAAWVLVEFIYSHCGLAREDTGELQWKVDLDLCQSFRRKPKFHYVVISHAILEIFHDPCFSIEVTAAASEYQVKIMRDMPLPAVDQILLVPVHTETIPADPESLLELLENYIRTGILTKSGEHLLCLLHLKKDPLKIDYQIGRCDLSGIVSKQCSITRWEAGRKCQDEREEIGQDDSKGEDKKAGDGEEEKQELEVVLSNASLMKEYLRRKDPEFEFLSRNSTIWGVVLAVVFLFACLVSLNTFNGSDNRIGMIVWIISVPPAGLGIWNILQNRRKRMKLLSTPDPAEFKEVHDQLAHDTALKKAKQLNYDRVWRMDNEDTSSEKEHHV